MHSRIFEIIEVGKESAGQDIPEWWRYETGCDYYHELFGNERADSIDWLSRWETVEGDQVCFGIDTVKSAYQEFRKILAEMDKVTERDFCTNSIKSGLDMLMWRIDHCYRDIGGFWFMDQEGYLHTTEDMERQGGVYKIGRVWDYHH